MNIRLDKMPAWEMVSLLKRSLLGREGKLDQPKFSSKRSNFVDDCLHVAISHSSQLEVSRPCPREADGHAAEQTRLRPPW